MTDGIQAELIFYSATYTTKGGWKTTFQIEEEAARQLDAIGAGRRYMAVLVPIADDEKPDTEAVRKSRSRAQMAGILCNDTVFQRYVLETQPMADGISVEQWVRDACMVDSRADLDRFPQAAEAWDALRADYEHWLRT